MPNAIASPGGGGGDIGGFVNGAVGLGQNATDNVGGAAQAQMSQIEQTAAMQMKFQTEMGEIQMIVKMNEALAKMFKALGDAIKGLAG